MLVENPAIIIFTFWTVFIRGPGVGLSVFVGMGVFALPVLIQLTKRRNLAVD